MSTVFVRASARAKAYTRAGVNMRGRGGLTARTFNRLHRGGANDLAQLKKLKKNAKLSVSSRRILARDISRKKGFVARPGPGIY